MAHEIGPVIQAIRQQAGQTQVQLYRGVLSARQAIRFESGASDIKAAVLFTLLSRLHVSPDELQYLTQQPVPLFGADAILQHALAKLQRWADWPLTAAETAAVRRFTQDEHALTLGMISHLNGLDNWLDPALQRPFAARLWRALADYHDFPDYPRLATAQAINQTYVGLFAGDAVYASQWLRRWQVHATVGSMLAVQAHFWQLFLAALPSAGQVYRETTPLLQSLRTLGETGLADALNDNRRHALTAFGQHPSWLPSELGASYRILRDNPAQDNLALTTYIATLPGLKEAIGDRSLAEFEALTETADIGLFPG